MRQINDYQSYHTISPIKQQNKKKTKNKRLNRFKAERKKNFEEKQKNFTHQHLYVCEMECTGRDSDRQAKEFEKYCCCSRFIFLFLKTK